MARERSVSDVCEVLALGWSFRGIVYASHVRYVPCHPYYYYFTYQYRYKIKKK